MAWPEPFGGLFFLVIIAVTFVAGLVMVLRAWKSKRRIRKGLLIIAAPWLVLATVSVIFPSIDDWNPMLESDEAALGIWEGDGYKI